MLINLHNFFSESDKARSDFDCHGRWGRVPSSSAPLGVRFSVHLARSAGSRSRSSSRQEDLKRQTELRLCRYCRCGGGGGMVAIVMVVVVASGTSGSGSETASPPSCVLCTRAARLLATMRFVQRATTARPARAARTESVEPEPLFWCGGAFSWPRARVLARSFQLRSDG